MEHPACAHIIKRLFGGKDPKGLVPNSGPAPGVFVLPRLWPNAQRMAEVLLPCGWSYVVLSCVCGRMFGALHMQAESVLYSADVTFDCYPLNQ